MYLIIINGTYMVVTAKSLSVFTCYCLRESIFPMLAIQPPKATITTHDSWTSGPPLKAISSLNPPAVLNAESLEVWRGGVCLFEGLDFTLESGQVAIVSGANGSGKTTLLRVLSGMSRAADGSVTWRGEEIHRLDMENRLEITYQGHMDGLKKEFTVEENLQFYQEINDGQYPLEDLLDELRLSPYRNRQVRYLSAGQRRRVALGCMKVKSAKLWLLDEPLTNLDARGAKLVSSWISEHANAGGLAVVATHQRESLIQTASIEIEL